MPEGPEVSVIRDCLNDHLKDKIITSVSLPLGSKFLKKSPIGYNDFKNSLPLKLQKINSKGKFIYFVFEGGWFMMCRLLMSGGWHLKKAPKNNHLEMDYKEEEVSKAKSIWFVDPRHFATLKWTTNKSDLDEELNKIGPDILNDNVQEVDYVKKLKSNPRRRIASVLMDQSVYSGVGNYLKAEILYETKISPHALIKNLNDKKLKELYKVTIEKIKASYKAGGANIHKYSDIRGKNGGYSFHFKVYQKKVDPLGNKVKTEKTGDGRTTHWVPEIQLDNYP